MPPGSSPAQTDTSSPGCENGSQVGDDGVASAVDNENEDANDGEETDHPSKRIRASSAEPTRSSDTLQSRWNENTAVEALKRAIQSSPARNLETHASKLNDETLTPKPVRRALFPNNQDGPLKTLGESLLNSPRRSPRAGSRGSEKAVADKENSPSATNNNLDDLFENPSFDFTLRTTPTPKRRTPRSNERRLSLPFCSPSANKVKITKATFSPSPSKSRQAMSSMGDKNAFPSVDDIVLDGLFDPWQSLPPSDMYIPFSDWSPTAENGGSMLQLPSGFNDEALINAVLSESELQKATDLSVSYAETASIKDGNSSESGNNKTGDINNTTSPSDTQAAAMSV